MAGEGPESGGQACAGAERRSRLLTVEKEAAPYGAKATSCHLEPLQTLESKSPSLSGSQTDRVELKALSLPPPNRV